MTIIQDEWIEWSGGECPVAPGTRVQIKCRDGYLDEDTGANYAGAKGGDDWWSHTVTHRKYPSSGNPRDDDIIAYKVVKEGEGG